MDVTLSPEDQLAQQHADEQRSIPAIENEDRQPEPKPEPAAPAPAVKEADQESPVDPRAARMEALANRSRDREGEELTQMTESTVNPVAPKPEPAPAPERMMKIKVRGEIVELPESEVIARAQKIDAADSYLTEARTLLEDAKRTARPAATEPAPAPAPAPAAEIDGITKAIEQIQLGADPAEVRLLLENEFNERARAAAREVIDGDRLSGQAVNFDADVDNGYAEVVKDHPELTDPIASSVVVQLAGGMEGEMIARFLGGQHDDKDWKAPVADQQTIAAFAKAGITADGIRRYAPADAHALFKDMHTKGYPMISPASIIKRAGDVIATRFKGPTPAPAAVATPAPAVDRSGRKAVIQQPERASIPRTPQGQFAPKTEPERAKSAREDMRSTRRAGLARG